MHLDLETGLLIFMKVPGQNVDKYISVCILKLIITSTLKFSSFSYFFSSSFSLLLRDSPVSGLGLLSFSSFEASGVLWREVVNPLSYHQAGRPNLCIYGLDTGRPGYPPRHWVARDLGCATSGTHNNCEPLR